MCFHVFQMSLSSCDKKFKEKSSFNRRQPHLMHCHSLSSQILVVCVGACVWLTHPSWSVRFHSTLGVGIKGEPSYKTTEAPTARADTSQFHIIQPVYEQNTQKHRDTNAGVSLSGINTSFSSTWAQNSTTSGCELSILDSNDCVHSMLSYCFGTIPHRF